MKKRTILLFVAFVVLSGAAPATWANHPVLVEGETDFDGDGLLGSAEDLDGDRIFGRITTALAADLGAINNNGTITIVTSGRFPESLLITGAIGNVNIEAAPGVDASIDAVLAGITGNVERQNAPGIVVDAGANRRITLRNLTIRNWRDGIVILGDSRVTIEDCRLSNHLNHGILARANAVVTIKDTSVSGTGFRIGAGGNAPDIDVPQPGNGITFLENSSGALFDTSVTGNFNIGLHNDSSGPVKARDLLLFDNATNRAGSVGKLQESY